MIHLDTEYWQPGWVEPDPAGWDSQVAELVARPTWIIDGSYGRTLARRLQRADTAIVLDVPTATCAVRILKRVFAGYGRVRPDMAPGCPERFDLGFMRFVLQYRRREFPRLQAELAAFGGTIVTLRTQGDIERFLASLPARVDRAGPAAVRSR